MGLFTTKTTERAAFDPYGFEVGEKVRVREVPGKVIGVVEYTDDIVYSWTALHVEARGERFWITVVDEADGVQLVRWEPLNITFDPEATTVSHGGTTYLWQEAGTGSYKSRGTTELPACGEFEFRDFWVASSRLSMERYDGGTWYAMKGEVLPIGDLERA